MAKPNFNIAKVVPFLVALMIFIIVGPSACTVVGPTDRGVKITFGQVKGDVIPPGIVYHLPFVTEIRTFSIIPKTYEVTFSYNSDGAITKDMQSVGGTVVVRYSYDENRIMDIVKKYSDTQIQLAMKDNVKASLKETVGKYSIYDLVSEQNEVTNKVAEAVLARMESYPIAISQTTITNWDWSDDFDRQIKETANRTQQVKIAQQEAEVAAANAQKQVREAEAKKQAMELEAEASLIKAQKEAEAKKAEADGIAYYNAKVAQNMTVQLAQWKHDEQMAYNEKWDGHLVPTYIPLTAAGAIVDLKK